MPKEFKKTTVAQTLRFDCDRYLALELSEAKTLNGKDVKRETSRKAGMLSVKEAGKHWETNCYQSLVDSIGEDKVLFKKKGKEFIEVEDFESSLNPNDQKTFIIQPKFKVKGEDFELLKKAYDDFHLQTANVIPDLLWFKPSHRNDKIIGEAKPTAKFTIHVIDVKLSAEPNMRHFAEVTYYALALHGALKAKGLDEHFSVSSQGYIWPGSHNFNSFRESVIDNRDKNINQPVFKALDETLIEIPFEVYQTHVQDFFENRLLDVLARKPEEAQWHVSPKCFFCDYLETCKEQAEEEDDLCRIPWMTKGQAQLLRQNQIFTVKELCGAIENQDSRWSSVKTQSSQLRAEEKALYARAKALVESKIVRTGRRSSNTPKWADVKILLTIHYDLSTGITFALGAKKIAWQKNNDLSISSVKGKNNSELHTFIVDTMPKEISPETEKKRLLEFLTTVNNWIQEVNAENRVLTDKMKGKSVHFYFWDKLEVEQLLKTIKRHLGDEAVLNLVESLINYFPPPGFIPEPDYYKSQLGTVVKDEIKKLLGLPIPFNYLLKETANELSNYLDAQKELNNPSLPLLDEAGIKDRAILSGEPEDLPPAPRWSKGYWYRVGFFAPMTDLIPSERAHELWRDRVFLKTKGKIPFSRDRIREGIREALTVRLNALHFIVRGLGQGFNDLLGEREVPFVPPKIVKVRLPKISKELTVLSRLDAITDEIEKKHIRSLPVDEREARYHSIRGLRFEDQNLFQSEIEQLKVENKISKDQEIFAFSFSVNSCNSRIQEGSFNVAISNESNDYDLELPWYKLLSKKRGYWISFYDASQLMNDYLETVDVSHNQFIPSPKSKASDLLQVTVLRINESPISPTVFLSVDKFKFEFSKYIDLIDLNQSMVLDDIPREYHVKEVSGALRKIGYKRKTSSPRKKKQ